MIKKKYNPDALVANTLHLTETDSGCCGEALEVCKYVGNIATLTALVSITLVNAKKGGGNVTYTLPAYTTITELKTILTNAIAMYGYDVSDTDAIRIKKQTDNSYNVEFIGEASFVSYVNGSGSHAFTKTCDKVLICEYKLILGDGTAVPFVYEGVTTDLGTITYPSTTTASLDTAITAAATTAKSVVVTADAASESYVVVIKDYNNKSIKGAGHTAMKCCCVPDYE